MKAPEYLAKTNYKIVDNASDGIWQYTTGFPGQPMREWLAENPQKQVQFGKFMSGYASDREAWVDIYPTEQILSEIAGNEDTILVDVGGSIGHDAVKLVKKHPETAGHVIVQDRDPVIASAQFPDSIKPMPHDFFGEQPVKGRTKY